MIKEGFIMYRKTLDAIKRPIRRSTLLTLARDPKKVTSGVKGNEELFGGGTNGDNSIMQSEGKAPPNQVNYLEQVIFDKIYHCYYLSMIVTRHSNYNEIKTRH